MKTKRDQGQPAEEPVTDIDEDDDDAAAEQEGTVEEDSQSSPAATGEETETVSVGTETDPFAELLKKKEFVPLKDYEHAARKITQQGQELSARDTEVAQLRQEILALRRDLVGETTEAETGQAGLTPSVGDRGLQQRLQLIEEALLEVYDGVKKKEKLESTSKRLGARPEIIERIQALIAEDRMEDALELTSQTAILQYDQKRKTPPSPKIMGGGGGRAKVEPPLKPEDLPADPEERKKFQFNRLKRAFGLT